MSKREIYIDKAKGIAILLIVIGHIILLKENVESKFCTYIYSFHVPIFFVLSGILFSLKKTQWNDIKVKEYATKKIKKFFYPYFTFSGIYILYLLIKFIFGVEDIIKIIKISLNTVFLFGYGPAWFLPTLCFSEIFCVILMKNKDKRKRFYFVIIICIIWTIIWANLLQLEFWQNNIILDFLNKCINLITRTIIGTFFIILGYLYHEKKYIINKIPAILFIIVLLLNVYISQINSQIDLHFCIINNIILFFYLAFSSSISIIRILECYFNTRNNIITFFGENSLIIMLTHFTFPVMSVCDKWIRSIFPSLHESLKIIFIFIAVMIIEFGLIKIINKKMSKLLIYDTKNNKRL